MRLTRHAAARSAPRPRAARARPRPAAAASGAPPPPPGAAAAAAAKGARFDAASVRLSGSLGEGSFGQVFKGALDGEPVVLKRVKDRVPRAAEMHAAEHAIAAYAARACPAAVADFRGYVEVPPGGAGPQAARLTPGVWLVWRREGDRTLGHFLRRRDADAALAEALGVPRADAVAAATRQILGCLAALHRAGVVHRDVKPANIVFSDAERRFKLIDLGAAADLRTGVNYRPDQTILDPLYCPPEEYVLPTDSPSLAGSNRLVAAAVGASLWARHSPGAFDSWSAGVVLLQLALPPLRSAAALKAWAASFRGHGYDLDAWRAAARLPPAQTAALDARGGAGWALAAALLRPRRVEVDAAGRVAFVDGGGGAARLTPEAALAHPFVTGAPGAGVPGAGAPGFSLAGLFRGGRAAAEARGRGAELLEGGGGGEEEAEPRTQGRASGLRSLWAAATGGGSGSRGSSAAGSGARQPAAAAPPPPPPPPPTKSLWARVKSRLADLEARLMAAESETQTRTVQVEALREAVAAGDASEEELAAEESALAAARQALARSAREVGSAYAAARGFLSAAVAGGGSGSRGSRSGEEDEAAAAGGGGSGSGSAGRGGSASQSAAAAPADEGEGAAAAGDTPGAGALVTAANDAIVAGLRLTAGAVTAAGDAVAQAMEGANRAAAARRAERAATAAFVRALHKAGPTEASRWEDVRDAVAASLPPDAAATALPEPRRRALYEQYLAELARAQAVAAAAARRRAEAGFAALLEEAAAEMGDAAADYDAFAAARGGDARFAALPSDAARRAAHRAAAAASAAARAAAAAAAARAAEGAAEADARAAAEARARAAADASFRALLAEHEPAVAAPGGASWAAVKRALWSDARFDAVPETRRRELHAEYRALLQETGAVGAAAAAAAAAAPAAADAARANLEFLRAEQARLRAEAARLAAKLASMESSLAVADLAASIGAEAGVEAGADGGVVFRFADPPAPGPPAAAPAGDEAAAPK